ncbi:pilus assembly protein PilZ [Methylobacterium segetis]|uniref:pilus assembly protein PilZ n=1 Tax=Methylobacterium segetis TaxID=2488750 RepID=UPI00104F7246|nr:pilus assembly protein PilZ [Methylobacterium segetis]
MAGNIWGFAMFVDRREVPRHNALKRGWLSFLEKPYSLECLIWNVSDFGALIEVEPSTCLPQRFRIVVTSLSLNRNAMQTWRDGRKIGVAFVS